MGEEDKGWLNSDHMAGPVESPEATSSHGSFMKLGLEGGGRRCLHADRVIIIITDVIEFHWGKLRGLIFYITDQFLCCKIAFFIVI